ncbi:outer membrane protein assembly factor BamB family protein [Actinomadura kijaniata]|uniref:outer membrane protein assembly factor BamB family protein n=1 Tax=Actinomadura kijaniata TaxID=46161 RepID=UPI0012FAC21B|nr:PQQ-binding-like beta-propeller repeat protein [Actinomadura kijaniata]
MAEDRREHGAAFSLTPATWNGRVFVEAVGGLHVRDARSGDLIQKLDHGCPTVVGDLFLAHGLNAEVRAFRLPELTPVWSRGWCGCPATGATWTRATARGPGTRWRSSAWIPARARTAGAIGSTPRCAASRPRPWKRTRTWSCTPSTSPVSGGMVYAATGLGEVHALDAATGGVVWTAEAGAAISHPHAFVEEPSDGYDEGGAAVVVGDRMLCVRTDAGVVAPR